MVLSPVRQWGIGSLAPPRVTACTSPAWRPLADRPVVVLSSVGRSVGSLAVAQGLPRVCHPHGPTSSGTGSCRWLPDQLTVSQSTRVTACM